MSRGSRDRLPLVLKTRRPALITGSNPYFSAVADDTGMAEVARGKLTEAVVGNRSGVGRLIMKRGNSLRERKTHQPKPSLRTRVYVNNSAKRPSLGLQGLSFVLL